MMPPFHLGAPIPQHITTKSCCYMVSWNMATLKSTASHEKCVMHVRRGCLLSLNWCRFHFQPHHHLLDFWLIFNKNNCLKVNSGGRPEKGSPAKPRGIQAFKITCKVNVIEFLWRGQELVTCPGCSLPSPSFCWNRLHPTPSPPL